MNARRDIFLVGFLVLFLELAAIRWFAAYVPFLSFFTNIVLIAAFLGMSAGLLAAERKSDWMGRTPWLLLVSVVLALVVNQVYLSWSGVVLDVGGQQSGTEVVFFGTEYRDADLAKFVLPIEAVAALFFVAVALVFVGPGQVMGRCFGREENRVAAYAANIAGSLAGIGGFALLSLLRAPPVVWFGTSFVLVAYFLRRESRLDVARASVLGVILVAVTLSGMSFGEGKSTRWSPYYRVVHDAEYRAITVNNIGHQQMWPLGAEGIGGIYATVHDLRKQAGGEPFRRVLVIGAGSGNDVANALDHGAESVDAVDIDPVILDLGEKHHPERPYDDPRVRRTTDDGRHFLRNAEPGYDLVVYGLVNSLILASSVGDLRLESFLFTEEALHDVRRVLAPDGVFVTMNLFRKDWVAGRIAGMAAQVFGAPPVVLDLGEGVTAILAGNTEGLGPPADPPGNDFRPATDDWPFLYLLKPGVPGLYLRSTLILVLLGFGIVRAFAPRGGGFRGRMFFLGAGFLLMETKAVVNLSLVFGSTWVTASVVFAGVLALTLAANLYVLRFPRVRIGRHYVALLAGLAAGFAVPMSVFLDASPAVRYAGSVLLALGPVFFAGVVFAVTFRESEHPGRDLGANIAGAVLGGFAEYLSMLAGFRGLLVLAAVFYLLSAVFRRGKSPTPPGLPSP